MTLSPKTASALAATRAAKHLVSVGTVWLHKKGGLYRVEGHDLDTDTGLMRVRYRRVGGPEFCGEYEVEITYSRPLEEWNPDRFTRVFDGGTGRSRQD